MRSVSKLYVQDACINRRDNELGLESVQVPICAQAHDSSATVCQSVFASGAQLQLHAFNISSITSTGTKRTKKAIGIASVHLWHNSAHA